MKDMACGRSCYILGWKLKFPMHRWTTEASRDLSACAFHEERIYFDGGLVDARSAEL